MITLLTTIMGLSVTATILVLIRKDRLHASTGFGWVLVAICFFFLGLAPYSFDRLAGILGVKYPPALAFALAIAVILIKLLQSDTRYSSLRVRHERLIQRVALLELQNRKVHSEHPDATHNSSTLGKDKEAI
jgi:hypothetical protein